MDEKIKFLIKVNTENDKNVEKLISFIKDLETFISLEKVSSYRLNGNLLCIKTELFEEFSLLNEVNLTIIYYDLSKKYAKKIEIVNGSTTSLKSIYFNSEIEAEILKGEELGIKDFLFDTLKSVI